MTIKTSIEAEAKKAAQSIREALAGFLSATGVRADVEVDWISIQRVDGAPNQIILNGVTVSVAGLEARA